MLFVIINAVSCIALIWASFNVDTRKGVHKSTSPLINEVLFCATLSGLMAVLMLLCFWAPPRLSLLAGRLVFMLMLWFSVHTCQYLVEFPEFKKNSAISVIGWVLNLAVFAVFFLVPGAFSDLRMSLNGMFELASRPVFRGDLATFLPFSWFTLMCLAYLFVIPLVTIVSVLVRSENLESPLERQRMRYNAWAVCLMWIMLGLLVLGTRHVKMVWSLVMLTFIPMVLFFIKAASTWEIVDAKSANRTLLRLVFTYLIPALVVAAVVFLLWPLVRVSQPLYFVLVAAIAIAFGFGWRAVLQRLESRGFLRDRRYAARFESMLASIDYSGEATDIPEQLFHAFRKYVTTSSLNILLDSGTGMLDSAWSSDDKKFSVPIENSGFDVLLNLRHPVVFREWLERDYNVASARVPLTKLLDDTGSDALILLNEGRRVIGVLLLGKKMDKNIYLPYDYETFTTLYSNFFVAGYYMKNIMNESVVGTVNREIRMSGQIITSIQENMDAIKSAKVDSGYIMVPAHNIGGEFIDLIRLTDTRHIIVIGSLSGKGIAASMNMVILKSVIRTFLAETKDFKQLVEKVNLFIRDSLPKGSFFAGTFALVDFATDTLYYINCGTSALFLYTKAYNNVIEIQGEGKILGFAKDIGPLVHVKKVKLAPGDVVVSCTDGLIETQSLRNEAFGKERVQKALVENLMYPASKIAQFTYDALVKFTSKELEDDVTVFVMKYLGGK